MMKDSRDVESALVTFLVTASGVSIAGVGSAFWGLVAGLRCLASAISGTGAEGIEVLRVDRDGRIHLGLSGVADLKKKDVSDGQIQIAP